MIAIDGSAGEGGGQAFLGDVCTATEEDGAFAVAVAARDPA